MPRDKHSVGGRLQNLAHMNTATLESYKVVTCRYVNRLGMEFGVSRHTGRRPSRKGSQRRRSYYLSMETAGVTPSFTLCLLWLLGRVLLLRGGSSISRRRSAGELSESRRRLIRYIYGRRPTRIHVSQEYGGHNRIQCDRYDM